MTDCNIIPDESINLIKNTAGCLDHVVIDGLRPKQHETHCSFDEALHYGDCLMARHTWLTHITHDMCHEDIKVYIQERLSQYPHLKRIVENGGTVLPAYDGLVLRTR